MAPTTMNAPTLTKDAAAAWLAPFNLANKVTVLGIRGYFEPAAGNKRGIYDDALFIISPDFFKGYNANCDPSVGRPGIAVLQAGTYWYKKGLHGMRHLDQTNPEDQQRYQELIRTGKDVPGYTACYWALRQDSNVVVKRDGQSVTETDSPDNRFWIDIHRGGYNTTSSLGCQTVHPDLWENFRANIFEEMINNAEPRIPYVLVENKINS